ncbi:FixH family protein [Metabacillus sp. KIGAM252]|uniref:FixH family protein n=1 Tax=Metabacillus flavus TaxID=2823519 RepID=A0ABS5LEM3_9BACI|nr:FixH family protein [Metabacillus flavus]MBS2969189.1 FixH family protein [Metabacillus flavus]
MSIIWKWVLAAALIAGAVTGAYFIVQANSEKPAAIKETGHSHQEAVTHASHGSHNSHLNEIQASVKFKDNRIQIKLTDSEGKPFSKLKVNHEKIMHLIVVSKDLKKYHHIHPGKTADGTYEAEQKLSDGNYKAFVDISPENAEYEVKPLGFQIGTSNEDKIPSLQPENSFKMTTGDYMAEMNPKKLKRQEPVTLAFSFNKGEPEPYLGASGHVVILDEKGEKYVHVHPASEKETKFETEFEKPGIYKIWAEFKFEGKVHVFPYTVKVEE